MTLLVRDEADIVASNIDFHLNQGVDFIIATDNLSVDATSQILREYERRGVLRYLHQPEDNYAQHRWVTHMARLACTEFAADWVINNDADEFWWPEQGDLRQVLGAVAPAVGAVVVERTNFVPRPMAPDAFFADVMTVRERRSLNVLGQPLPSKVCHRALPDVTVTQGNHAVECHGQIIPAVAAPITILHFPMRSYHQFANKIAKGGAACNRNTDLEQGVGDTWRRLYELYETRQLEPYYRASMQDDADIEEGLRSGRLVFDERLKRALSKPRCQA